MVYRNFIKATTAVLGVLVATTAMPQSSANATRIVGLLARSNGLYFNVDRVITESSCSSSTLVVRVDTTINELAYKTMAQSISLAFAMDKSVNVYLDGCVGIYPRAIAVDVY